MELRHSVHSTATIESEIAEQFDVVVHIDATRAVRPLEPPRHWAGPDLPETFPHGL